MDFELSENQAVINSAVLGILEPFRTLPVGAAGFFEAAPDLERGLSENGFFDFEFGEDFTPLDAALMVYEGVRLPVLLELGATPSLSATSDGTLPGATNTAVQVTSRPGTVSAKAGIEGSTP